MGSEGSQTVCPAAPRLPELVWLDTITAMVFVDDPVAVHDFRLAHAAAAEAALDVVDSLGLITQAAQALG